MLPLNDPFSDVVPQPLSFSSFKTVVTENQFVKYIIRKPFKSEHHLKCK